MYSCTLGKVLNLVICLRYMYFFKKYLKLLRLYFRYRYVSLPDCLATMSARGSGRTWRRTNQALRQPTGFRAELYAEELRTATPKECWNTRVYCARAMRSIAQLRPICAMRMLCIDVCAIDTYRPVPLSSKFS